MRIAIVSTILHYPWGGADVLWTRLAAAALARGDAVLVAVAPAVAEHARVVALQASGAILHRRDRFTQQRGNRDRWQQTIGRFFRRPHSLTAALDSFKPDLVLLAQGGVFDFLIEDGLRQWLKESGCAYASICQSNDERDQLAPDDQAVARGFITQARHMFFVSNHNRDHAARQVGAAMPNARVVQNPIEFPLTPAPAWPSDHGPRLAVVSRLEIDPKGLDVMLDAVASVPSHLGFHVSLYGRGTDEAALRARARALAINSRVTFRGYEADVRKIWAEHHCLLLPSRREGCALAMLEALACGRPVIATDVGGVRDWIISEVSGFICRPGDVIALGSLLTHALAQQLQWPTMGIAALRGLQARFDPFPEQTMLSALLAPNAHVADN